MNRREFVTTAAAGTLLATQRALGANDRIRLGLIGAGGRGSYIAHLAKTSPGTEFVAACDAYEPRRLEAVDKLGTQSKAYLGYRELLDRSDIDAVMITSLSEPQVTFDATVAFLGAQRVYMPSVLANIISRGRRSRGSSTGGAKP